MVESSLIGLKRLEKGQIAHYEQFLLFPQCFQKTCRLLQTHKNQGLFGKGLKKQYTVMITHKCQTKTVEKTSSKLF